MWLCAVDPGPVMRSGVDLQCKRHSTPQPRTSLTLVAFAHSTGLTHLRGPLITTKLTTAVLLEDGGALIGHDLLPDYSL
jgi:hypothetical protein